jgi:hypothetical protein
VSQWHTVDDADISVDIDQVDILVTQNDQGNVYVSLTFEQVEEIYKEIQEKIG